MKVSPPADSTDSIDSSLGGFFPLLPQRRRRFKMIQLIPFVKFMFSETDSNYSNRCSKTTSLRHGRVSMMNHHLPNISQRQDCHPRTYLHKMNNIYILMGISLDASSSLNFGDDGAAVCYLCLDGGVDDAAQPLRRDCACRGSDAGFVHLSCLADYAETKSKQAHGMNLDMDEFTDPWANCPSCHQEYQNELAIDIANKFVSFVRRQYPDDTQRQVESLYVKLRALDSVFESLQPRQKREFGVTANVLLSLIDWMKNDALSPLPRGYSQMEAFAYNTHGRLAVDEGTEESARRALTQFEDELEVYRAIGNDEGIVNAKANIAIAKSIYEDDNSEELLETSRELYEVRVAELGEEHGQTIHAGRNYAIDLQNANRGDEARELLMKLLATSKQVLGPHHSTTKDVENTTLDRKCTQFRKAGFERIRAIVSQLF